MAWKIIRNSEPPTRQETFVGICPIYKKNATITVQLSGSYWSKTDLQKTYHKVGCKCSLLEETKEDVFSSCMINCPLVSKEYL